MNQSTPRSIISLIEQTAQLRLAAPWDKSGLQIRGIRENVLRLAVTLDPLPDIIEQALNWKADFILTHHPLALDPKLPAQNDDYLRVLRQVLTAGSWLYSAHTSLDARSDGPVAWLAKALGLGDCSVLEPTIRETAIQLTARIPDAGSPLDTVLEGLPGVLDVSFGPEMLTVVCWPDAQFAVSTTLRDHGFGPATTAQRLEPDRSFGFGLVGDLPQPLSWRELRKELERLLPGPHFSLAGSIPDRITRLAYCPGSGGELIEKAFSRGAQVYLTGDLKYHQAHLAHGRGLAVDVGHFVLEELMMRDFAKVLSDSLQESGCSVSFFPGRDPFLSPSS